MTGYTKDSRQAHYQKLNPHEANSETVFSVQNIKYVVLWRSKLVEKGWGDHVLSLVLMRLNPSYRPTGKKEGGFLTRA